MSMNMIWSHNDTSVRIVITKSSTSLVAKDGRLWGIVVIAWITAIIAMFVIVIRWGRLRSIVGERAIAMVLLKILVLGLCCIWKLPQLSPATSFSNSFQNLLLLSIAIHSHLLQFHVYLNAIHPLTKPNMNLERVGTIRN